jgi:cellobiose PTS system EIIA component
MAWYNDPIEVVMKTLEQIAFTIIAQAGSAKSTYLDALELAKKGDTDHASALLIEGDALLRTAHQAHMEVITQEANGNTPPFSLLLVHAEDQINTAEIIRILVSELMALHTKTG